MPPCTTGLPAIATCPSKWLSRPAWVEIAICEAAMPANTMAILDRRLLLRALQKHLQLLAADIHSTLVAIQLIELIVTALVLHRRVVHREDRHEILGVLGDRYHRFRLVHPRLVRLARGGRNRARERRRPSASVCRRRCAPPGRPRCLRRNRSTAASCGNGPRQTRDVARGPATAPSPDVPASFGSGRAGQIIVQPPRSEPCAHCPVCRRPQSHALPENRSKLRRCMPT